MASVNVDDVAATSVWILEDYAVRVIIEECVASISADKCDIGRSLGGRQIESFDGAAKNQ